MRQSLELHNLVLALIWGSVFFVIFMLLNRYSKQKRSKGKHEKDDQSPLITTKKRLRNSDFISDTFLELKQLNRKAHTKGSSDNLADMDSKRKEEVFLPQLVGGKSMLKESDIHNIVKALPISQQMYDWQLLFCSEIHGSNLDTFYRLMDKYLKGPSIMVVQDDRGCKFGVFTQDKWRPGGDYYGTGSTFVMSISPKFAAHKWTYQNEYFLCCKNDFLAVGGGETGFAIWLDSQLERGTSSPCTTFDNPRLSGSESFVCTRVELWSLGLCFVDQRNEPGHEPGHNPFSDQGGSLRKPSSTAVTPRFRPQRQDEADGIDAIFI
jgi:hypothetical protein